MRRPGKRDPAPAPLYLTQAEDPTYCLTCGRIISSRKAGNEGSQTKHCSDGCRRKKPGPLDRKIERTIYLLLQGQLASENNALAIKKGSKKDDSRILISCDAIEALFFNRHSNQCNSKDQSSQPGTVLSKDYPDALDPILDKQIHKNEGMKQSEQANESCESEREVEGSPSQAMKTKQGQKRAEERESVRRAARRAVVFGIDIDKIIDEAGTAQSDQSSNPNIRKCEAVQNGRVVEASFAKGDWALRWRD